MTFVDRMKLESIVLSHKFMLCHDWNNSFALTRINTIYSMNYYLFRLIDLLHVPKFKMLSGRGDRMKQAKADSAELIAAYKAEKQEEFNNMVLSKGGSEGDASAKLQTETNKEVAALEANFQKNAQKAVDVLLSKCCEVSLEVPTARVRATRKMAGLAN